VDHLARSIVAQSKCNGQHLQTIQTAQLYQHSRQQEFQVLKQTQGISLQYLGIPINPSELALAFSRLKIASFSAVVLGVVHASI
jgi:hypothetical protein